jgi:hypothetical protein
VDKADRLGADRLRNRHRLLLLHRAECSGATRTRTARIERPCPYPRPGERSGHPQMRCAADAAAISWRETRRARRRASPVAQGRRDRLRLLSCRRLAGCEPQCTPSGDRDESLGGVDRVSSTWSASSTHQGPYPWDSTPCQASPSTRYSERSRTLPSRSTLTLRTPERACKQSAAHSATC